MLSAYSTPSTVKICWQHTISKQVIGHNSQFFSYLTCIWHPVRGPHQNIAIMCVTKKLEWWHWKSSRKCLLNSGVARPMSAWCRCQIWCPSVFGDTGEPIQPYCLHFLALHRNTATRSVSQHNASNFHFQFHSGGRRLRWLRQLNSLSVLWFLSRSAMLEVRACVCPSVSLPGTRW